MYDRHHFIEEPCEVKVSSTVLKTGGVGDDLAEFNRQRAAHAERTTIHFQAFLYLQSTNRALCKLCFCVLPSVIPKFA
jgi:hypothetical protein